MLLRLPLLPLLPIATEGTNGALLILPEKELMELLLPAYPNAETVQ